MVVSLHRKPKYLTIMTKKELILNAAPLQESKSFSLLDRIESSRLVKSLAKIYSALLEERISAHRTLKLVHAQLAMGALLLLGGISVMAAVLLCAWAVLAIWQCRM